MLMKSITKKLHLVLVAALLLNTSLVISNTQVTENKMETPAVVDNLIGTWEYTVENVSYEYSKGVIIISKDKKNYSVEVQLSQGSLKGENVVVKGNTIKFVVYIEGQGVDVELTSKGNKISGESSTMDGSYHIEGKRKPQ